MDVKSKTCGESNQNSNDVPCLQKKFSIMYKICVSFVFRTAAVHISNVTIQFNKMNIYILPQAHGSGESDS